MPRRWFGVLLPLICWLLPQPTLAFSVAFVNPGRHDEPYWLSASQAMQAAARDLDIELEVLYAERDHLKMIDLVRQVTARSQKPDYLIVVNEKLVAPAMLRLANAARLPTLLAYNELSPEQRAEIGRPRRQLRYWLGSLAPDNEQAGYDSLEALIAAARQRGLLNAPAELLMISGDPATPASVERLRGAQQALAAYPQVRLVQVVNGMWQRERAYQQANWLLARHPRTRLIWTANDLMAFGVRQSLQEYGRQPGRDVLIATVNNSQEVMRARIDGEISALSGGHFLTGAWALVMLYDYAHGKDFATEGLELRKPIFGLITPAMAQRYLDKFAGNDFDGIGFRRFSRRLNPTLRHYDFRFQRVLE
ncbi:ABC transporter substrate-binding protein [Pseudogulbenkiania sp. MAI-1]|uniref:ABC transporter substrate-binding protein n=1 Tax=Pseudogulbenkiania sp. MAI-1 TaxID=990370 RepID=UPI00045E6711|nr:ABC transporter substrate-binding protein [Pseudogulbenkiania sp. MAI-1]